MARRILPALCCGLLLLIFTAFAPLQAEQTSVYLVFFRSNGAKLEEGGLAVVKQIVADVNASGGAKIALTGHTDTVGSPKKNLQNSIRMASEVRDALVKLGIPSEAITVDGKGESELAISTVDGMAEQANRRVEVLVKSNVSP